VEDHLWDSFFAEEARVLKSGGRVFHEVPHRLAPFEPHTRTWFLHSLPRPVYQSLYKVSGRGDVDTHILRLPLQPHGQYAATSGVLRTTRCNLF
jgi:hypothetical protein